MEKERKFDLEERTTRFAENILDFSQKIKRDEITRPLISQLIRAGTSIGANYCEADCAESRKDFEHKIGICKKEAKETGYWLKIFKKMLPDLEDQIKPLLQEAIELQLIFVAIVKKSKENNNKNLIGH